MLDLRVAIGSGLARMFNDLSEGGRRYLLQPVITILMFLGLYLGWNVAQEGGFEAGFRAAFVDDRASRATRDAQIRTYLEQSNLRSAAHTNSVIETIMSRWLSQDGDAARVRLSIVHNGVYGITGLALMHFDVTNAVVAPGHAPGPMVQNAPLADWSQYLSTLLSGSCSYATLEQTTNSMERQRLMTMAASARLVCPVTDTYGRLLGGVFMTWDHGVSLPDSKMVAQLSDYGLQAGSQIAAVLSASQAF